VAVQTIYAGGLTSCFLAKRSGSLNEAKLNSGAYLTSRVHRERKKRKKHFDIETTFTSFAFFAAENITIQSQWWA